MMKTIINVLFLVAFIGQVSTAAEIKPVNEPIRVHGRLSVYNGNPSCRIWIVGSNRVLGIRETDKECPIPPELDKILMEDINDRAIFADFIVTRLTEYKAGVMQIVRIESAENIVVTNRKEHFLRHLRGAIDAKKPR